MAKNKKLKEAGAHLNDVDSFFAYMEGADCDSVLTMTNKIQNLAGIVRLWLHRLNINTPDEHPTLEKISEVLAPQLIMESGEPPRDKPNWPAIVGRVKKSTSDDIEKWLRELRVSESARRDDAVDRNRR